jgi:peptide/nickel transport system permease protein
MRSTLRSGFSSSCLWYSSASILTYVITHATPIDPVEQSIAAVTSFGNTSPEAINMMRQSLRELYGLTGGPFEQYVNFWRRIAVADFGPSLSAFPTPVSTLIARALPWTIGLWPRPPC